jgi:hypothetical protein
MALFAVFGSSRHLVGLTLANVGAGLSGTFVVNGSPTKTQMVDSAGDSAGGRTPFFFSCRTNLYTCNLSRNLPKIIILQP